MIRLYVVCFKTVLFERNRFSCCQPNSKHVARFPIATSFSPWLAINGEAKEQKFSVLTVSKQGFNSTPMLWRLIAFYVEVMLIGRTSCCLSPIWWESRYRDTRWSGPEVLKKKHQSGSGCWPPFEWEGMRRGVGCVQRQTLSLRYPKLFVSFAASLQPEHWTVANKCQPSVWV